MKTDPNSTHPGPQAHSCCGGHAHADGTSEAGQVRPYPLDVCLVSDEPLGAHGPPHAFVHEGREIKLCCAGCLNAFYQDPAKFLQKLDRTAAEGAAPRNQDQAPGAAPLHGGHHHSATATAKAAAERKPTKPYFCPMCPGVEGDAPGDCPKCGMRLELNPAFRTPAPAKTIYTCPMHPEIEQDHPGNCPICGMTLEPKALAPGTDEDDAERRDMEQRFWVAAALTLPVFLLAMAHLVPGAPAWADSDPSRWVQFLFSAPVVLWAGWPFFERGWRSVLNRHLNMFTLIALGVGVAWLYSAAVMLAPGLFPPAFQHHGKIGIYFESAAVITVLVLFGQVLELRARSRTGSAIRALLDMAPRAARLVRDGE